MDHFAPASLGETLSTTEPEQIAMHLHSCIWTLMNAVVVERVPDPGWNKEIGSSALEAMRVEGLERLVNESRITTMWACPKSPNQVWTLDSRFGTENASQARAA